MSEGKEMVSFLEDTDIIKQVDAVAKREGTHRSAIFRRAVRNLLFSLPHVPGNGNSPIDEKSVKKEAK